MSTTRKSTPPTNQAEYTAWRAEQKRAEQAAKQAPPVDYATPQPKPPKAKRAQRADKYWYDRSRADAAEDKRWADQRAQWAADDAAAAKAAEEARKAKAEQDEREDAQWKDNWERRTAPRYTAPRSKAHKAADLAVSAHGIGSTAESYTAATRAGALYRKAGEQMSDLLRDCPGMANPDLWRHASAGFAGN